MVPVRGREPRRAHRRAGGEEEAAVLTWILPSVGRDGTAASRLLLPMAEIVTNSKARRDFHILETLEAGIVLRGTEVKSLRAGKSQIADSFARVEEGQVYLYNSHIDEYGFGNKLNHLPKSRRKLLLHRREIQRLAGLALVKGNALVPLSMYWKNGKVKVALAVGRGKQEFDKREDVRNRESARDLKRAMMQTLKRG